MYINSNARKILSKDIIEMIEAGILTTDLNLTSLGRGRIDALNFKTFEKELLADAKEINENSKADTSKEGK